MTVIVTGTYAGASGPIAGATVTAIPLYTPYRQLIGGVWTAQDGRGVSAITAADGTFSLSGLPWPSETSPQPLEWRIDIAGGQGGSYTGELPDTPVATVDIGTLTDPNGTYKWQDGTTAEQRIPIVPGMKGDTGAPGAPGANGTNGTNGAQPTWRGTWSSVTAYIVNDAININGASYICILAHTNQTPPNATYWQLLSAAQSNAQLFADFSPDQVVPQGGSSGLAIGWAPSPVVAPVSVTPGTGGSLPAGTDYQAAYAWISSVAGLVSTRGVGSSAVTVAASGTLTVVLPQAPAGVSQAQILVKTPTNGLSNFYQQTTVSVSQTAQTTVVLSSALSSSTLFTSSQLQFAVSNGAAYVAGTRSPLSVAQTLTLAGSGSYAVDWDGTDGSAGIHVTSYTTNPPALSAGRIRLALLICGSVAGTGFTQVTAVSDARPKRTITLEQCGAKGDWLNPDGTINSSPTDDTAALLYALTYMSQAGGDIELLAKGYYAAYVPVPYTNGRINLRIHGKGKRPGFIGTQLTGSILALYYDGTSGQSPWPNDTCVLSGLSVSGTGSTTATVAAGTGVISGASVTMASNTTTPAVPNPGASTYGIYALDWAPGTGFSWLQIATWTSGGGLSALTNGAWTAGSLRLAYATVLGNASAGSQTIQYLKDLRCFPKKFESRGQGRLEVDHLTIYDASAHPYSDPIPLFGANQTVCNVHDDSFVGPYPASWQRQPIVDAIHLGGTGFNFNGKTYISDAISAYSVFGGYGSKITNCDFANVRRALYGRCNANTLVFTDGTVDGTCGADNSAAAIEFDGSVFLPAYGSHVERLNIETMHYAYPVRVRNYANDHTFLTQTVSDPNVATLSSGATSGSTTLHVSGDANFESVALLTGRPIWINGTNDVAGIPEQVTISSIAGATSVGTLSASGNTAGVTALTFTAAPSGLSGASTANPIAIVIGSGATQEGNYVTALSGSTATLLYPLLSTQNSSSVTNGTWTLTVSALVHSHTGTVTVTPTLSFFLMESNQGPLANTVQHNVADMGNWAAQCPAWTDLTQNLFWPGNPPLNEFRGAGKGTVFPGPVQIMGSVFDSSGNAVLQGSLTAPGGATLGSSGTLVKALIVYSVALSPSAVAANTTAEYSATVTGVTNTDIILDVVKPTAQAGLGIVGWRKISANTVGITFCNTTAGSITPTAAETYKIVALTT